MEKRSYIKNQKGFTLIEIIAVLVILGILAAVAVPKFINLSTEANNTTSDAILGELRSTAKLAFAAHRLDRLTASGTGDDQYITDRASLQFYMEDGLLPAGTTMSATAVTFPNGSTSAFTAETNTTAATFAALVAPQ